MDSSISNSNNKSGGFGTYASVGETSIVKRADDADGEDGADVKAYETPEIALSSLWEIASRRLHLAAGDNKEFGREGEGECGEYDNFDEGDKATCVAWSKPGVCCSWVLPVVKTEYAVLVCCNTLGIILS